MTHTRPLKKLGEIILVIRNGKSCKQTKDNIGDKITRIETISDGTINEKKVGFFELSEDEKEKFSIEKGDILFSHINSVEHIGKVALAKKDYSDLFHGMNLLLIRADKKLIDPEFLYVVLNKFFEFGYRRNVCKKAINQASLNQPNIIDIPIPLPPLATQQFIVAKLDETFAQIDEAIATTQANIDQTDELTKSVLDKVFEEGGYEKRSLNEIVQINSGVGLPSIFKDSNGNGEIPFYKVGQMNNDKKYMKNSPYFFTLDESKEYKIKIFPKGSVLIPKRGAAIFTNKKRILLEDASYDSNVMGLKAKKNLLSDEFLYIFLNNLDLGNYVDNAGIPQINNKHIEQMKIPLPPLPKQVEIVSYLDHIFAQSSQLKEQYQKKLVELKELKASVLQSAFEGKLV